MIEGVRNNKYTDAYINAGRRTAKVTNDAPSFLPLLEEDGAVWDRQSGEESPEKKSENTALKNQDKKNDLNSKKDTYESTVLNNKPDNEIKKKPAFMEPWSIDAFAGAFKNLFKSIRHVFKGLFDFIWYGEDKKEEDTGTGEEAKEIRDNFIMPEEDEAPAAPKKSDDKKEKPVFDIKAAVRDLHPENAARSTDLLTTYNKFGKAVRPSKSDESLILRGDRSYKA